MTRTFGFIKRIESWRNLVSQSELEKNVSRAAGCQERFTLVPVTQPADRFSGTVVVESQDHILELTKEG